MCGRYYVDDETAKEIEKIVRSVDEKLKKEAAQSSQLQKKIYIQQNVLRFLWYLRADFAVN